MSKIMKGLLVVCGAVIVCALPAFAGNPIPPRNMPEPGTIAMLVSGLGAVAGLRYYKLRKR
jgi:predicted transporter